MKTARQIVNSTGMSARPEFYSGRGARWGDLNPTKLRGIYAQIKREYGKDASKEFVEMVRSIPVLTATDFLDCLYDLEENNWRWRAEFLRGKNGINLGRDISRDNAEAVVFASILGAMTGREIDETEMIRGDFLRYHEPVKVK